jgi:hypothetical protein
MIIIALERRAMLELVREYDVAKRFRKLKKSAPKSIVAVPFWGKGALTLLGIGGGQKSQIVCNCMRKYTLQINLPLSDHRTRRRTVWR